jgi:N6-adenosine-specific RNA methylase IME4
LTETSLDVVGPKPTRDEYEAVGEFINRTVEASGFWRADWIAYGDGRPDWKDHIDALVDADVMSEQSAKKARYMATNVPKARRVTGVGFAQHYEVAGCDARDQVTWLKKAKDEQWTARELRENIRASKRTKIIAGQAVLKGMYRVIYADPPWLYSDSGATADGSLGKAERHYPGMTIEALCKLPVAAHALPNAVLFLWVTAPFLLAAAPVIEAWGFTYKTNAVWDKVLGNFGHYFHIQHEHLLVCTRGSCVPDVPVPSPKSVLTERRTSTHSEKPETMRRTIQGLYTTGPYLELFGRHKTLGWDVFGNDARLWAQEASS